jgi:3D (Asp-Asp-Asp) domain-containing protein
VATRTLQIVIAGDPSSASRAFRKVEQDSKRMGDRVDREGGRIRGFATITSKGMGRVGLAAGGMATAGVGAAALLSKSFVSGATAINESLSKNRVLFGEHADAVDRFSQRTAKNFGISRQAALEATGTFGNLFTALEIGPKKSAGMSVALTRLAADMASFNNASPEETLEAIRSGLVGETEPLRRFGVNLNDATLRSQALKMGLIDTVKNALTPQQKALAVNALLFKQTAKAQGDFARTSGGLANQQRILKARFADAGAELGGKLMPAALAGVRAINSLFDSSTRGGRAVSGMGRAVSAAAGWIKNAWADSVRAVQRFAARNREDIQAVVQATRNMGRFIRNVFEDVIIPVIRRLLPIWKGMAEGVVQVLRGLIRIVSGIINGDWARVWQGFKDIPAGIIKAMKASLRGLWQAIRDALKALVPWVRDRAEAIGKAIVDGITAGLKKAPGKIAGGIRGILRAPLDLGMDIARGNGDGIGRQIQQRLPIGGAFGGSLMGADPRLKPFAAMGSRFGLTVTSGRRPGAITSSGNQSWHSTGEAIDMGGSAAGMLAYARMLRSRFGSRLAELIYTPMGVGISNGRPYTPTGQVAADHYDHVHVAFDVGRPGQGDGPGRKARTGDGLGQFVSTAYGPPWNAMNGTGVTATGVDLRPARQAFGIAVDPSRLRLGKSYYVWPNPFGRKGPFKAFDTGGAIKGNRIDFYDWRGRKSQLGWGRRSVRVSDDPALNFSGGGGTGGGAPDAKPKTPGTGTFTGGTGGPGFSSLPGGGGIGEMNLGLAKVGVQKAQAERDDSLPKLIQALRVERSIKQRRLRRINKYLRRKRISRGFRQRLLEEKAALIGEIGELGDLVREYRADARGGAQTISRAEELEAGVAPDTGAGADTGGGGGGGAAEPDPALELSNRLLEQLVAATTEKNERDKRLETLMKQQTPALERALLAMFNAGIGQSFGRGHQAAGVPGSLARS